MTDDRAYWDSRYAEEDRIDPPSPFARFCAGSLRRRDKLIEIGCGSGRDLLYFREAGINAVGYDNSERAVEKVNTLCPGAAEQADFTRLPPMAAGYIYSRFTLHAIDDAAEKRVLQWASDSLSENGYLLVEVRTTSDPLYGVGQQVGQHAFVSDHYRRFADPSRLKGDLKALGFAIEFNRHAKGQAIRGDEDPMVLRLIARRGRR